MPSGPLGLGLPTGAEWLCLIVLFALLVGVTVLVKRNQGRSYGFPVGPAGPGRFRVSGVRRDTRQDVTWECDADSPANARVKAELDGIVVTGVTRLPSQPPVPPAVD